MSLILLFGCKPAIPLPGEPGGEGWWGGTDRHAAVMSGTQGNPKTPRTLRRNLLTFSVLFFSTAEENLLYIV